MNILNNINENEIIEINAEMSVKTQFKNTLIANLMYVLLWLCFDVFFVYIMTMPKVTKDYWFMAIPVIGLNIIFLWSYLFKVIKESAKIKDTGFVLTNKAVYYYSNNKYKSLVRISFEEIIVVERSEYIADGFYVASENNTIHIHNVKEEKELFDSLVAVVKK